MLVKVEKPSHWYLQDGTPFYEVEKKAGGMRKTDIRDARKVNAVPSVTTILSVLAKPQLEAWKINQDEVDALNANPPASPTPPDISKLKELEGKEL